MSVTPPTLCSDTRLIAPEVLGNTPFPLQRLAQIGEERTICEQGTRRAPGVCAMRAGRKQGVTKGMPASGCPDGTGTENVEEKFFNVREGCTPSNPHGVATLLDVNAMQPLGVKASVRDGV